MALERFVASVFAPLFFASIGLCTDLARHFDLALVLALTGVATVTKVAGGWAGARLGGLKRREAWAVGHAINSRGAMQIVLGMVALKQGMITERLFVALVVMALATSMMAGPLVRRTLGRDCDRHFGSYLHERAFLPDPAATTVSSAIVELSRALADAHGLDGASIAEAVLRRERTMATGLEHGVAVPHGRLPDLRCPIVALGICRGGLDFGCFDGQLATFVVPTVTPSEDDQTQLQVLADISLSLGSEAVRNQLLAARNVEEVRAALEAAEDGQR